MVRRQLQPGPRICAPLAPAPHMPPTTPPTMAPVLEELPSEPPPEQLGSAVMRWLVSWFV